MMRRFWFEFEIDEENPLPIGISNGCGVSAYSYDDAISILETKVFVEMKVPSFKVKKEDVDISLLDENHILPNMGDVTLRGVWFPLGY